MDPNLHIKHTLKDLLPLFAKQMDLNHNTPENSIPGNWYATFKHTV